MFAQKCPRADELESIAAGQTVSKRARAHAAACPICSQVVAALARDVELVRQLREVHRHTLDDDTRAELIDVCRKAAQEAKA